MSDPTENAPSAELIQRFVGEIEKQYRDLASEKALYMKRCQPFHAAVRDLFDAAKDAGLARQALKLNLEERKLERKLAKMAENLDDDDRDLAEYMREKLADFANLPLGAAAVDEARQIKAAEDAERGAGNGKAKRRKAKAAELDDLAGRPEDGADLRPRFLQESDGGGAGQPAH
jgi:hypothetical protein